jgi:hypothetical protein
MTPISVPFVKNYHLPTRCNIKKEQLEKDKELVQMHTDFSLVLQVLFHAALDAF